MPRPLPRFLAVAACCALCRWPAGAEGLSGRALLSWQTYDSLGLASSGLHQQYDLRLDRALTELLRLRLTLRAEDDASGSTLLGETRSQGFRQLQPGAQLSYSLPTFTLQGTWDRLETAARSQGSGPTAERWLERLVGQLTYRPEGLPALTLTGLRHQVSDPASATDLTDTFGSAQLDYAWRGLHISAVGRTAEETDDLLGFARRSSDLQGLADFATALWGDRLTLQTTASFTSSRLEERATAGAPVLVPRPVPIAEAYQAYDETPLDSRDRPLEVNPRLRDGDLKNPAGVSLGPDAQRYLALAADLGREALIDELRVVARDPAGNPVPTGGSVAWDLYTSTDGVLWAHLPGGAQTRYDPARGLWSVTFRPTTTRWIKGVTYFLDTVPAEVTELLAFYHTEVGEQATAVTEIENFTGSGSLVFRPIRGVTLSWYGLYNGQHQTRADSVPLDSRDREQLISVQWQAARWTNVELQRQSRRSTHGGDLAVGDQAYDAWTGYWRLTPNGNLSSTVEMTRIDQEIAGQALTTDRLFVHTYARLWPALDVNLDLGRQQLREVTAGWSVDSPALTGVVHAALTGSLQLTVSASLQRNDYVGNLPPGTTPRAADNRWWAELFWRPSGQLGLAVRSGRVTGGGVSGILQGYHLDWRPFAQGTLSIGGIYDEDVDPLGGRRSRRLIFTPSWAVNPRLTVNLNYSALHTADATASTSTTSLFVSVEATF